MTLLDETVSSLTAHIETADQVLTRLQSDRQGLSQAEAERRLEAFGPNTTPQSDSTSIVLRFLRHFHNALIYVLLFAAAVTWWLGHPIDTAVIVFVVLALLEVEKQLRLALGAPPTT